MKAFFAVVLIGWVASAHASAPTAAVNVQPDRFHPGQVVVASDPRSFDPMDQTGPHIMWSTSIDNGKRSDVALIIAIKSDNWRYLDCHNTAWLADGKPLDLQEFVHDGQPMLTGVQETLTGVVTPDQLVTMLRSRTIEYKICGDEYRFTQQQMAHMVDFGTKYAAQLHH